jgi:hypothetical protein
MFSDADQILFDQRHRNEYRAPRMKILLTIAIALSYAQSAAVDKSTEELNIREAVFRYQVANNALSKRNLVVYCLAVGAIKMETDPDDAFMKRFEGMTSPMRKVSECLRSRAGGVTEKSTGNLGVILFTESIRWISDSEAEIDGGDYIGPLAASHNTYYLKKINSKWNVLGVRVLSVS